MTTISSPRDSPGPGRFPPLLDFLASKERIPLAAPRRYYPGFFGALFLVLLRTAIGWHFFYEGVYKINSTPSQRDTSAGWVLTHLLPPPHDFDKDKDPPFSAEGYLRNATGPLATHFRALIPDVNSMAKLDRDDQAGGVPTRLKAMWRKEMDRVAEYYGFDEKQKAEALKTFATASAEIDGWFLRVENAESIKKYNRDLRHVLNVEESPDSLPYQRTEAYKSRKKVEAERKRLAGEVDAIYAPYRDAWVALATDPQIEARGALPWWRKFLSSKADRSKEKVAARAAYAPPPTSLDWINLSTMWGMVLVGACLMLGLFTPLAALGGVAYLLMFYLSLPPWPGLPTGPAAEGHYLYINKNMIELMACLVLASTPNGLWIGLDALLFGRFGRRKVVPATPQPFAPTTAIPLADPRAPVPTGGAFRRKSR